MTESIKVADKFLDLLYGEREGVAEIRILNEGKPPVQEWYDWPAEKDTLLNSVKHHDWDNVFMGALLRTERGKGDADHTEPVTEWLWADVDKKRGATFGGLLSKISHYPQLIVDSGHGWHLYWHLRHAVPVDIAQGAMEVLADRLGGDRVGDPARVMRLPGTLNRKDDDDIPVRILRFDPDFTHRISDFDQPVIDYDEHTTSFDGDWEVSSDDAPKFPEGERNAGLTRLAGAMLFKGMDSDEMMDALLAENEIRCDPPLREREVRSIVRSVGRYR